MIFDQEDNDALPLSWGPLPALEEIRARYATEDALDRVCRTQEDEEDWK